MNGGANVDQVEEEGKGHWEIVDNAVLVRKFVEKYGRLEELVQTSDNLDMIVTGSNEGRFSADHGGQGHGVGKN